MNKLRRMVSGDTRILRLWGKPRFSHPEICSGDQFRISLRATIVRSSLRRASKHGLGRRADFQAWWSALLARYRGRPPWRATSRLTVEAARCKLLAISRIDEPEAMPRETSSRSASVRVRSERRRTAGTIPPCCDNKKWIEPWSLPKTRPISCNDSPAFQRRQISVFWAEERPYRLPTLINTTSKTNDLCQMVLHPPVELAGVCGNFRARIPVADHAARSWRGGSGRPLRCQRKLGSGA